MQSVGDSTFKGLTLQASKRLSQGLTFNIQYVTGKGIDNTPLLTQLTVQAEQGRSDPSNLDRDKGPNPLDMRHNLSGNIVYTSSNKSSNAVVRALLDGNQIGVLLQLNSSLPVNIRSNADLNGDGVASDRPLFVGRNSLYLPNRYNVDMRYTRMDPDPRIGARRGHRRDEERVQHRADVRLQLGRDDRRRRQLRLTPIPDDPYGFPSADRLRAAQVPAGFQGPVLRGQVGQVGRVGEVGLGLPGPPASPDPPALVRSRLMKRSSFRLVLLLAALIALPDRPDARRPARRRVEGHVALGLALRHLGNAGIFMHTTAHPDDENNGLLVMLNRGQGYRTALATATRGNGGQNEIGPEIFEALGVLRTGELAALHRFDGAEQYFTRAVDFGYSFSIEETFEKWGRDEITADYVRLIRMIRPDVIITLPPTGNAGGQHHMASAVITRDAYKLAADPAKYPEQIKEGLRPWQPRKLYQTRRLRVPRRAAAVRAGSRASTRACTTRCSARPTTRSAPRRAACTSARAWASCSRCRRPRRRPPTSSSRRRSPAQMQRDETSLFDGVDSSIMSLAKFVTGASAQGPDRRPDGDRQRRRRSRRRPSTRSTTKRRSSRCSTACSPSARCAASCAPWPSTRRAKYEIDFRLRQKEGEFQQAAILAKGIKIEVLADDGVVVPGQPVKVNVIVANRGAGDVAIKQVKFDGFDGDGRLQRWWRSRAAGSGFPAAGARAAAAPTRRRRCRCRACERTRSRTASRR